MIFIMGYFLDVLYHQILRNCMKDMHGNLYGGLLFTLGQKGYLSLCENIILRQGWPGFWGIQVGGGGLGNYADPV